MRFDREISDLKLAEWLQNAPEEELVALHATYEAKREKARPAEESRLPSSDETSEKPAD